MKNWQMRKRMMRSMLRGLVGVLILAWVPVLAQAKGPEINLNYETFTLSNGLRVIVHEDRKAPIVAISIWYHVGSRDEPAGKTGFAHLFEHLMFNGSENYDGEWFEAMQAIGATGLNGTTWLDRTNYFQSVPTPALDYALWLESDRMGHLLGAVTQEKLDNQRGVVQNEKRQGDNQPYGRVNYPLYEGLFPEGHPYRHSTIGSMQDLDAASLQDVHQWFKDFYGPNNAVLSLAGDIDLASAKEKVELFFGDIPAGPNVDRMQSLIPTRLQNTKQVQYDAVPAVMANRAWVVAPRTAKDKALLDIVAAVLGRGRNSRFYSELVYEQEIAASVSVSVAPFELASVFDLSLTLNAGQTADVATKAIDEIVSTFLESGPSQAELERVVAGINASIVRGLETVGGFNGKAAILAEGALYADNPLFIKQYLDWINAATSKEVKLAARRWLGAGWHQVNVLPKQTLEHSDEGVNRRAGLPKLPNQLPALTFPEIQRATLGNGVEVILAERHALPLVEVTMQFDAGYAADSGGKLGVSSFATEMLDLGTAKRSALEVSATAERLGARLSASAGLDTTSISLSALADQLAPSLELWADVIQRPSFADAEIERLRVRRLAAIEQEKAQPVSLALRVLPPMLYGENHAYGIPYTGSGTADSIQSLNRDDLVAFQSSWLRPDNAKIFIVGDTTLDDIVPVLEKVLRGWRVPPQPLPRKNIAAVDLPSKPRYVLMDKPGAPQSLILAGHLVPGLGDSQDLAIEVMNEVLGGSFTSRINMNLREDKGWAYGARTLLMGALGPRPFLVYAPVQTDRTGDSVQELQKELSLLNSKKRVSEAEMSRVIAGLTRELPGRFETSNAVLGSMTAASRYGRPLDYAASLTRRYEMLELANVHRAAALVKPESFVWLIVGDVSQILPQLEALGLGPVEIKDF